MGREVLLYQMTERFQELYCQALDALERAAERQWVSASEFAFRDAFLQLMKESYEAAIQTRLDAHPTADPARVNSSGRTRVYMGADGVMVRTVAQEEKDTLRKNVRAKAKIESLRLLRQYIMDRWETVDYPNALARGWDIGSGPTEAACKNLTLQLKRTGMRWDMDNAAGMMTLIALRESGQWATYWKTKKTA